MSHHLDALVGSMQKDQQIDAGVLQALLANLHSLLRTGSTSKDQKDRIGQLISTVIVRYGTKEYFSTIDSVVWCEARNLIDSFMFALCTSYSLRQ